MSKADKIFVDHLLKDKQFWLLYGHKLPPHEELTGKKYYKWHNSFNHATSNCIVFKKIIHKAIKERRFKLVDKGIVEMTVDSDPFLVIEMNMVSFSSPHKQR